MIKRIKRNLVLVRICPNIQLFPIENRIEFGDVAPRIQLFKIQFAARFGLAAALSGQPCGGVVQSAVERFDFADMAATAAQLDAVVHRGCPKLRFKFGGGLSIGIKHFQFGLIARIGFGNQRGSFGIEFARIERDDADGQFQTAHGIGNDHILNRKAGCEHGLRIAYGNVLQTALQSGRQLRQAAAFVIADFGDFPELWAE